MVIVFRFRYFWDMSAFESLCPLVCALLAYVLGITSVVRMGVRSDILRVCCLTKSDGLASIYIFFLSFMRMISEQ
jgi:hypothetical protein